MITIFKNTCDKCHGDMYVEEYLGHEQELVCLQCGRVRYASKPAKYIPEMGHGGRPKPIVDDLSGIVGWLNTHRDKDHVATVPTVRS